MLMTLVNSDISWLWYINVELSLRMHSRELHKMPFTEVWGQQDRIMGDPRETIYLKKSVKLN